MTNLLLLLGAAALMPFANGRWSVALAAWIAPALLIRFLRGQPPGRGAVAGIAVLSLASFVWWFGIFPVGGAAYAIASIVIGAVKFLPFLADRLVAPRLRPALSALVFPTACLVSELIDTFAGPFGNWASIAYSQAGVLPLLQILSIAGLGGVTFLVAWFASAVNTRRGLVPYVPVLVAVVVWGGVRLQSSDRDGAMVKVAAVTPRVPTYTASVLAAARSDAFRPRARAIDDELLGASAREARAGAKLVVWSEGAGIVDAADEPALLARAGAVARSTQAYFAIAYLSVDRRGYENKVSLVAPDGRTLWTYRKAHPVPGMESCPAGDGRVPVTLTPYGRIASVICFDADFPALVAQAGRARADLLLLPADDWREIAPRHARMAPFRAIEQGFAIVRSTSNGLSLAVDRHGRVHASASFFDGVRVLRARVAQSGAPTIYARTGDVVPWAGAIAFVALVGLARRRTVPVPSAWSGAEELGADA